MVLKVEFAFPDLQVGIVLHPGLQLLKIGAGTGLPDGGDALDAALHAPGSLQHLPGGAAAAIAIAVAYQNVVVDFLILVTLPAAHKGVGMQNSIIRGKEVLLGVLANAQGGDQMGQHLGAVDAPPEESVVGNLVDLIPRQFGGHEIVHAALLHDLGQSAGIAKYVWQPQNPVVLAKLLPEEPLAIDKLTDQRLTGGQVTVRFQPHTAFCLPATLFHSLLNLGIELGIALLQEVIQHRLAGHKFVFGILVHKLQDCGERANHLLPGLGDGPPPGHIDVGVADAGRNHIGMAAHLLI